MFYRLFLIALFTPWAAPLLAQDYAEDVPDAVQTASAQYTQNWNCDEPAFMFYEETKLYALVCESSETQPVFFFSANGDLKKSIYTLFAVSDSPVSVSAEAKQMAEKIKAKADQKIGADNEVQWIQKIVENGKPDVYTAICFMSQNAEYISYMYDTAGNLIGEKPGM